MIGHDLAGRYEIISRIGGGGMALVYKAHDILLNRNVAVKVLRQQFVNDEEFIRRFRREGQSAAALSHPNVVSIYDVGQEEDIHYIVMEYVEGHNLNEIITERAPLQIEESVHIAQQICDALDHAHANHIIHRDIKPHNILIGNNGRVKVTDFGIARAVTASTITHTGSVVGSVHYFSPEHAKGVNTGEKSDLYSLGIVLYQMLTGQLPFLGESPISVALKHLQENFEEPRVVNSHIPQSVENIILKSMRKNPNERYESARAMMGDLETCLSPERLYEPKIVFLTVDNMQETKIMPAIRSSQTFESARTDHGTLSGKKEQHQTSTQWEEKEVARSSGGWKKPLIVVLVTLVALGLIIWGFIKILDKLDPDEVDVPYVVGKTEDVAREMLSEAGLKVDEPVTRETSRTVPIDVVMEQSKSNMRVKAGSFVKLTISSGPELKVLSEYTGQTKRAAINALAELGIKESQISFVEEHSNVAVGTILEQTPAAGIEINPDDVKIVFKTSLGPEIAEYHDLVDMRLKDVRVLLKSLDLVVDEKDITYEASYLHDKDHVISQGDYTPNSALPKGSKVKLTVSSGYPKNAKSYQFNVRISPASLGSSSEVKIYFSDARGDNMEMDARTITSTVDIPVTLVLDPDTIAQVSVYRDGVFMDIKQISYKDISSGKTKGITVLGEEPDNTHVEEEQNVFEHTEEGGNHEQIEHSPEGSNDEQ